MAKFHGIIGYAIQTEVRPGVCQEQIVERECYATVLSGSFVNQQTSEANEDLRVNNRISIVANTYAIENFQFMRYITYMGVKWRISNVDVSYPELILTIGGVYNARPTQSAQSSVFNSGKR